MSIMLNMSLWKQILPPSKSHRHRSSHHPTPRAPFINPVEAGAGAPPPGTYTHDHVVPAVEAGAGTPPPHPEGTQALNELSMLLAPLRLASTAAAAPANGTCGQGGRR